MTSERPEFSNLTEAMAWTGGGFGSPEEFLRYLGAHAQTPRALVHFQHLRWLFALAGDFHAADSTALSGDGFLSIANDGARKVIDVAWGNVEAWRDRRIVEMRVPGVRMTLHRPR